MWTKKYCILKIFFRSFFSKVSFWRFFSYSYLRNFFFLPEWPDLNKKNSSLTIFPLILSILFNEFFFIKKNLIWRIFFLTWMTFTDRFWCEQKAAVFARLQSGRTGGHSAICILSRHVLKKKIVEIYLLNKVLRILKNDFKRIVTIRLEVENIWILAWAGLARGKL